MRVFLFLWIGGVLTAGLAHAMMESDYYDQPPSKRPCIRGNPNPIQEIEEIDLASPKQSLTAEEVASTSTHSQPILEGANLTPKALMPSRDVPVCLAPKPQSSGPISFVITTNYTITGDSSQQSPPALLTPPLYSPQNVLLPPSWNLQELQPRKTHTRKSKLLLPKDTIPDAQDSCFRDFIAFQGTFIDRLSLPQNTWQQLHEIFEISLQAQYLFDYLRVLDVCLADLKTISRAIMEEKKLTLQKLNFDHFTNRRRIQTDLWDRIELCNRLVSITITNCALTEVTLFINEFPALTYLNLSQNNLQLFPLIKPPSQLQTVILSGNCLSALPRIDQRISNLALDIGDNNFGPAFRFSPTLALSQFSISNNPTISPFKSEFFPNLTHLHMGYTSLQTCPNLRALQYLVYLDVSNNLLYSFPDQNILPSRLRLLNISYNPVPPCPVDQLKIQYWFLTKLIVSKEQVLRTG